MSTYLKKLTNPKTGEEQVAVCADDYYGSHVYGYGFKREGTNFTPQDFGPEARSKCDFYRAEDLSE